MKLSTLFLSSVALGLMAVPAAATEASAPPPTAPTCQPAPTTPCGGGGSQVPFIQNEQIQLSSSFAGFDLDADAVSAASAASAASANLLTAGAENASGLIIENVQGAFGTTTAHTTMDVGHASGAIANSAAATANGLTVGTDTTAQTINSTQVVHPGADVNAWSYTRSRNVYAAANAAAAGGNVATLNGANSGVDARIMQNSAANIRATAESDHCCVRTAATGAAVASANNITGTSTGGGPATLSADQRSSGREVIALVDLYVGYTGDALATSAANGNAATYGGAFAPLEFNTTQVNTSAVTSSSAVTVGGDFTGSASASSYGVGNSAVAQNTGADARFTTDQYNGGRVTSYTTVSGSGGVGATGVSMAVGNMTSGAVCTACGPATLIANNRQINNGAVVAATTMVTGSTGHVVGAATAVGNSATYTIRGH
jgi:hypothetical protein